MRKAFVPADFVVPNNYSIKGYSLELITAEKAVEDWLNLHSSAEQIVKYRGGVVGPNGHLSAH